MVNERTSPRVGVSWVKGHQRWQARIFVDGKQKHLGNFRDPALAIRARERAEKKYGYNKKNPNRKMKDTDVKFPGAVCIVCGREADDGYSFSTKELCARDYRNRNTPKKKGGHASTEWLGGTPRNIFW